MKKDKKKILGQFFTSEEIADFMIGLSNKPIDSEVLEPCFGRGVFLKKLIERGYLNIKGYELDHEHYEYSRALINNIIRERERSPELLDNHDEEYSQERSTKININANTSVKIYLGQKNFLDTPREEKFDLIIGNPPYVHWNNIDLEVRKRLKNDKFWKEYSNGEWDLLYAFIIWSIEKLKLNGELILITPYNWFNSTYASSLREYLIENGIFEIIIHFGEFKLFKDCYPNNIIFRYRKLRENSRIPHDNVAAVSTVANFNQKSKRNIFVIEYKKRRGDISKILKYIRDRYEQQILRHQILRHPSINKVDNNTEAFLETNFQFENDDFKIFSMPHFTSRDFWYLANYLELKEIDRIERATEGIILKDYLEIGVGIVSGLDEAFLINETDMANLSEEEQKLIIHFVKAKNCKRYFLDGDSLYIFTDPIQTETELKKYPNIYKRLIKYKGELGKRFMPKSKSSKWWQWATVRNMELFKRNLKMPKIFVPCIDRSLNARYSYTQEAYFGSGDVLIIVKKNIINRLKEDLRYILAWLNSRLINNWYRIKGSHTGHRIRYTQNYVSHIPLNLINWENTQQREVYDRILSISKKIIESKVKNRDLENKIDMLFDTLIELKLKNMDG